MEIPYTVDARPDTGLNNGKLGTWLFLASEVMLFGALFATYIMLRVGGSDWPSGREFLKIPLATLNTAVLITSSVTMVMAWASSVRRNLGQFRFFMGATVLLGFGFMIIKYIEYTEKFHHHYYPATNTFLAIYFTMTGLHALHVLLGMCLNSWFLGRIPSLLVSAFGMGLSYFVFLIPLRETDIWVAKLTIWVLPVVMLWGLYMIWRHNTAARLWKDDPHLFSHRVEHSGLFWHFVDLVWIFLFPVFYLL